MSRKIRRINENKNVFKLYHKVRDHCHYTAEFREAAQKKTPKEIPIIFHYGSIYDYHFTIK